MKSIDRLDIPDEVLAIASRLEDAGFETWCVGGAVRDNLLGSPNSDFDLATSAKPSDVQRLFRRTIPIGIDHGTVAVLDQQNAAHEVTTFRQDVETDGRHAVVVFGGSIDDDLARRDFTINAIAYHPQTQEWRDPHDGRLDLERGVVRAVGDATVRLQEDYLRILRGVRFASRFGFAIEPGTWHAMRGAISGLEHLSAERIRAEWFKTVETGRRLSDSVSMWSDVGGFTYWFPEFRHVETPLAAKWRTTIDRLPKDPVFVTAFLSGDPGETLLRLRGSNADVARAAGLGEYREQFPSSDPVEVRSWMSVVDGLIDDLLVVARVQEVHPGLSKIVEEIRHRGDPIGLTDLAVTGSDILAAGVAPGPEVGKILRLLLQDVHRDPALNERQHLLARVAHHREMIES